MALRLTAVLMGKNSMQKWAYAISGFNQYGLLRDDCLYEDDDVLEALRRIPPHVVDERNFRIIRATQLCVQRIVMPKDEWTKLEDDVLYLTPMVEQVKRERQEREAWESVY